MPTTLQMQTHIRSKILQAVVRSKRNGKPSLDNRQNDPEIFIRMAHPPFLGIALDEDDDARERKQCNEAPNKTDERKRTQSLFNTLFNCFLFK